MQDLEKNNSIGPLAVLAGLWFINILIVIFGMPFLIFRKLRDVFFKPSKTAQVTGKTQQKSSHYFPCRMDS